MVWFLLPRSFWKHLLGMIWLTPYLTVAKISSSAVTSLWALTLISPCAFKGESPPPTTTGRGGTGTNIWTKGTDGRDGSRLATLPTDGLDTPALDHQKSSFTCFLCSADVAGSWARDFNTFQLPPKDSRPATLAWVHHFVKISGFWFKIYKWSQELVWVQTP